MLCLGSQSSIRCFASPRKNWPSLAVGLPFSKSGCQIFSRVVSSTEDGTRTGLGLVRDPFMSSDPDMEALLSRRLFMLSLLLAQEAASEN